MTTILFTLTMFGLFAVCGLVVYLLYLICPPVKWFIKWAEDGGQGRIIDYKDK